MRTLVKTVFGSRLYGTNTEFSDTDYKAVHLPTKESLLLKQCPDTLSSNTKKKGNHTGKNTSEDTDFESYCLQYFLLYLGKNGDTTFLDMLHAPDSSLLETSPEWEFVRANRHRFYTKSLKSYMGYARKHAQSFVFSSAKMKAVEELLHVLNGFSEETRLADIYDTLPDSAFSKRYEIEGSESKDKRTYDFCGKKFMVTSSLKFIKESLERTYKEFGERTRDALNAGGVNLKSLSHAFRVGFQLEELYSEGSMTFPLKQAEWLREMKLGKLNFKEDKLSEKLEELLDNVETLAARSSFPEKVEMSFWEDWLVSLYN